MLLISNKSLNNKIKTTSKKFLLFNVKDSYFSKMYVLVEITYLQIK